MAQGGGLAGALVCVYPCPLVWVILPQTVPGHCHCILTWPLGSTEWRASMASCSHKHRHEHKQTHEVSHTSATSLMSHTPRSIQLPAQSLQGMYVPPQHGPRTPAPGATLAVCTTPWELCRATRQPRPHTAPSPHLDVGAARQPRVEQVLHTIGELAASELHCRVQDRGIEAGGAQVR